MALGLACSNANAQSAGKVYSFSTVPMSAITGQCGGDGEGVTLDPCASYVLGVADALQMTDAICRPNSDIATRQTVAIVRKYVRDHPDEWATHPVILIRSALGRAFPCQRNAK
jgi:hypothetical protein